MSNDPRDESVPMQPEEPQSVNAGGPVESDPDKDWVEEEFDEDFDDEDFDEDDDFDDDEDDEDDYADEEFDEDWDEETFWETSARPTNPSLLSECALAVWLL